MLIVVDLLTYLTHSSSDELNSQVRLQPDLSSQIRLRPDLEKWNPVHPYLYPVTKLLWIKNSDDDSARIFRHIIFKNILYV